MRRVYKQVTTTYPDPDQRENHNDYMDVYLALIDEFGLMATIHMTLQAGQSVLRSLGLTEMTMDDAHHKPWEATTSPEGMRRIWIALRFWQADKPLFDAMAHGYQEYCSHA